MKNTYNTSSDEAIKNIIEKVSKYRISLEQLSQENLIDIIEYYLLNFDKKRQRLE